MGADYYNLLGLPRNASAEEIRKAFFEAARRFHPDANPDPRAQEKFIEIQKAYDTLTDPQQRSAYSDKLPDSADNSSINLHFMHSREILQMFAEDQLFYSLIRLECSVREEGSALLPLNLCLVIDRSTSMAGARLDTVKYSVIQLLKLMDSEDIISIVTFSDRAEIVLPPTRVENIKSIETQVNSIQTGGATEIFRGLESAVGQLHFHFNPHSVNHILLLTDGHTYGDEEQCYQLVKELVEEGGSLSAMGIGHEWNDDFLDHLTALSGENVLFAPSPRELYDYLKSKLLALKSIYAKNISVNYRPSEYCDLRSAFHIRPEAKPLPDNGRISLGSLSYGSASEFLLEINIKSIPRNKVQLPLGELEFVMDVPSAEVWKKRLFSQISRRVELEPPRETIPERIIQAMEMLSLYQLQEQARQETARGDIKQAVRHLGYLATNLLAKGEKELGQRVLLEMSSVDKSRVFSKDGDKRIKYGTRTLVNKS
ncbi:MAG: DnaJ domain-containing protein [Anaerolineaceae bacterium]